MKKFIVTAAVIFAAIICGIFVITNMRSDAKEKSGFSIGMLLIGSKDDKSYNQSHYEGITAAADELGLSVMIRDNVPTDESSVNVMEELISAGCRIIVCTSFGYSDFIEKVAAKYPDVYFYHATGTESGANLASFFGRMYQIRYLSGIAAGLRTNTNEIGYIAAFDISEVNRGINAFTLGVRSVNPDASVYVEWCNSWTGEEEAGDAFERLTKKHDIDVITIHTDATAPLKLAEENGIWSIGYNLDNSADYPHSVITSAVWKWENFYKPQINGCINGNFIGKHYWENASTGIVSLAPLTANAAFGTAEAIKEKSEQMNRGEFDVFYGPIRDNKGNIRIAEGECMSDDAMLNDFDWYVEGVVTDDKQK